MRVAYIHQYFATEEASTGIRSLLVAQSLVRSGAEVTMLTTRTHLPRDKREFHAVVARLAAENIKLVTLPGSAHNRDSHIRRKASFVLFALSAALYLVLQRRRHQFTSVIATSTPLTVAAAGLIGSATHGSRFVFEVRDVWPDLPIAVGALSNRFAIRVARWIEATTYKRADSIIALSPEMAELIRQRSTNSSIFIIPNFAPVSLFEHLTSSSRGETEFASQLEARLGDRRLLVYAGTLGPINGVHYLAALARQLKSLSHSVAIVVAGDGALADVLVRQAKADGTLDNFLYYLGLLPKPDAVHLLRRADLSLSLFQAVPEMTANSANKFFDSLAVGTPVAINYGGWQAEIIQETGAGLILPPTPDCTAAETVLRFVEDHVRVNMARDAAAVLAREDFNASKLSQSAADVVLGRI
jgi:glycosyltransferase involved in cell wall biosynthesis